MERQVYGGVNAAVAAAIPAHPGRVLDLGCGDGSFGTWLKGRGATRVTGVTIQGREAELAARVLDEVIETDLDRWEPAADAGYDGVVASHVLEHLVDPGRLLQAVRRRVNPGGWLVVGLPNVLFWRQRLAFFRGHFRYTQGGLMDDTHLRFFDWVTAQELVTRSGWNLEYAVADGGFPGSRWLGGGRLALDQAACRAWPGTFGFQFVFRARLTAQSAPSEAAKPS
jgi:SAM-dependent methyltransferase